VFSFKYLLSATVIEQDLYQRNVENLKQLERFTKMADSARDMHTSGVRFLPDSVSKEGNTICQHKRRLEILM
jgi:hypothetical protein